VRALLDYRNNLVEINKLEYGTGYDQLQWLNYYQAIEMEDRRAELLSALEGRINWGFEKTKTDVTKLSKGCQLCGDGEWSCLFINGQCNCNCFYCPAPQTDIGVPVTQTLSFEHPESYVDYIRHFNFKGVSFSGGEPFLTFDRVKRFLTSLRNQLPSDLYIWMYTNGTRVTIDQLRELANLGLNEIRYDIGATDYNLKPVKQAIGIIPVVTVEIPAVPDEIDNLKKSVKELADAGLSHLNLHQLRLTPHNFPKLVEKGYSFAHGPRVTVPDSEITAFELLHFTKEENIDLPVNYCSFVYKNRFQKSGLRKKLAPHVTSEFQSITKNGYLRSLSVNKADIINVDELKTLLSTINAFSETNEKILFHEKLLPLITPLVNQLQVTYTDVRITESTPKDTPAATISLRNDKTLYIEKGTAINQMNLPRGIHPQFIQLINGQLPELTFENKTLFTIYQYEQIENGLSDIF
jgi:pyruvate formate-lyase activating enzyme-like uncharacterized protein